MRFIGLVVIAIAACGRFDFDALDDGGGGDGPAVTGPVGPRWLAIYGPTGSTIFTGGSRGEAIAVVLFQGSLTLEQTTITGGSPYGSEAATRFDPTGAIEWTTIMDSVGYCHMRHVTMDGDTALVTGLTIGVSANPAFGPCSVATSQQDPIVLAIDSAGNQRPIAHWTANGQNAQGWATERYSDGTLAMTGVYGDGGGVTIGQPLAPWPSEATFVTRFEPNNPTPRWVVPLTSPARISAGALATDGDELCAIGTVTGASTLFASAVPYAGGTDVWLARLDGGGAPIFVRAIGSTGNDDAGGAASSIIALAGGGCATALRATSDVTIDGTSFPVQDGTGLVVRVDASGNLVGGLRLPTLPMIAVAGQHMYAAFTVSAPLAIAGATYTPAGNDVIVVELDASGVTRLVGSVAGAGDQSVLSFAAIAPDAAAIGVQSTGEISFATITSDPGSLPVVALAVLGVGP